jgi:acetylornithine deacetylase/succinyl-diaminopimelate desuccinylase-like protein
MAMDSREVLARIDAESDAYLEELKEYLRIPSISTDPEHDADVDRCCDFLLGHMREAGLTTEKIATERHPMAYGEWMGAPGKPTVLFYGHYDVQPPDPLELWRNPPFEPTVEGDLLVARGATDDKGQSYCHVKAIEALIKERGELPVNVKLLVEGEEESGGESIDAFVRQDGGDKLACDCIVVSDTAMYAPRQPSLLYGLKGLAYMEVKVTGPGRDLHSGTFGGAVANPANALAHIVSELTDTETGRVLIPGFYDDVKPLTAEEREQFGELPFDEQEWAAEIGVSEPFGEAGYTTAERVWARPTCDVNGIFGGYQGQGAKTVLPSWAGAKISMRLVPDQDPATIARLFQEHVEAMNLHGVSVEVNYIHGAPAVLINTDGPFFEAAMAAQEDVWGNRPVLVREGGSIPIVGTFSDVLQVPVMLIGFGLSDDRLHSPNEKFNISHYYNGIKTVVRLLDRLG